MKFYVKLLHFFTKDNILYNAPFKQGAQQLFMYEKTSIFNVYVFIAMCMR